MNRAQRRRLDREAKKKPLERLESLPGMLAPVEMTPARIAAMKQEIAADLIRRSGDQVAIEQAKLEGYEKGHEDGERFAQEHYLKLVYTCMGLAMAELYGFRARRIAKVWHKADEIYGAILQRMDDEGMELDDLEEIMNLRMRNETGLSFDLTHSAEDLRNGGQNEK